MLKKLIVASLISMPSFAVTLKPIELDGSVSQKIEKYVARNSQSVTYFKAQHDLVGVGVVSNDYRKNVFYTNETGDFLLSGVLIDTQSTDNLTAKYADALQVDLGDLPQKLKDLPGVEQGTGDNEVYAVIDVNCGYCHRMWNQMQSLLSDPNSNVKVKWITVGFLGKQSVEVAQQIYGTTDSSEAYAFLSSSMNRQPVTTDSNLRVQGKDKADAVMQFMQEHSFSGVPLVVSKISDTWNMSPGMPSADFFTKLVSPKLEQPDESLSE